MNNNTSCLKKIIGILGATVALVAITVSIFTINNNGTITIFHINYGNKNAQSTPVVTMFPSSPVPGATEKTKLTENSTFNTENFVKSYLGAMTMAINNLNFSNVSDFLAQGSEAYNDQKIYIEGQRKENNLQERLVSVKILSENQVNSDTITVRTRETYDLSSVDTGRRTSTFETEYTIEIMGSDGKITNINNLTQENYN